MNSFPLTIAATLLLAVLCTAAHPAAAGEAGPLELSGDLRLRLEQDWDSLQANGTPRDDRLRLRARGRLAVDYHPAESLRLRVRLRSGSDDSQQSPHVTLEDFDDNPRGDAHLNLDQWYVRGETSPGAGGGSLWGWAGRNSFPFWKRGELFWDDDVTPAGVAGGWSTEPGAAGGGTVSLTAGYFALPAGMRDFSGTLAAGQVVYEGRGRGRLTGWQAGLGLYDIEADADDPAGRRLLLTGNGGRDYRLAAASFEARTRAAGRPLTLGADLFRNLTTYSSVDPDPFTARHHDDRDGWAVSAALGSLDETGGWQAAYTYARIEALAVHSSYAQDDWVRWGSAAQTRASNLKGHELRIAWRPASALRLTLRYFEAEALDSPEDGRRARLDLDFRF